jgi:phosphoheptose isomerase
MSTISASTTTTTAYSVTADTTGTLVLQTGSTPTTAVTIDGSQNTVFAGTVRMAAYTVATLPAAGTAGRRAYVTNALTPVALSAVVGGGAVTVPVFDNGSTWIVG